MTSQGSKPNLPRTTDIKSVQVYICGGIDATNTFTMDICQMFDPETNTWTTLQEVRPPAFQNPKLQRKCTVSARFSEKRSIACIVAIETIGDENHSER